MNLVQLGIAYAAVGVGVAWFLYRRGDGPLQQRAGSAALGLLLWPLWAPIAFSTSRPVTSGWGTDAPQRIEAALREGVEAARGTPLEALLSETAATQISENAAKAADRHQELCELMRRPGLSIAEAERRVEQLERAGASHRALASARLQLDNANRLAGIRDKDAQALEELADLLGALRTQLVLARYSGSSVEGVGGLVSEMWARVEGLTDAMDAEADLQAELEPVAAE